MPGPSVFPSGDPAVWGTFGGRKKAVRVSEEVLQRAKKRSEKQRRKGKWLAEEALQIAVKEEK